VPLRTRMALENDRRVMTIGNTPHRPWPIPRRPWVGRQSWSDLLFAHWPVPAATLRPHVPPALVIQEMEGSAWLGVVPFLLTGLTVRALPWGATFREVNVRTYVERDGKAGVWFFSLDADSGLAVWGARTFLNLPYRRARITMTRDGDDHLYEAHRRDGGARFSARYRPAGAVRHPLPGTLEHFLTERYCLYTTARKGGLTRIEIHHPPWPLQDAIAQVDAGGLLAADGVGVRGAPSLLHFARRLDVVVWSPEHIAT
jgi:uncharacterized protein